MVTGLAHVDQAPQALRDDPAKWWADLAEHDIRSYSVLKAAVDLGYWSWYHIHRTEAGTAPAHTGTTPFCCGSPMWAAPDGWVCRVAGYTTIRRPYAEVGA